MGSDKLFTYNSTVVQYEHILYTTVYSASTFWGHPSIACWSCWDQPHHLAPGHAAPPDHLVTRDVMMYCCRANAKKCRALVAAASTYSSVRRLERPRRIRDPLPPWLVRGSRAPEAPAEGPTLEARCRRPVFARFGFTILVR